MSDPVELSNEDWTLEQIAKAKSMNRLEQIATDIKYDSDEGVVDYVKDIDAMGRIRGAWARRRRELRS